MSKFLIWSLAFRRRTRPLAKMWLKSLLQIGKWRHEILLLGDRNVCNFVAPQLKTINIVNDIKIRHQLPRKQWTAWTVNNFKSQILNYVDVKEFDYILYLDIDVLINSDRLESLIRDKWQRGVISVQRDCIPLNEIRFRALEKMGLPDASEKALWSKRPICAGMIGFPINRVGLSALQNYHQACVEMQFNWSDQAKLAALLNRKYDGKWEFLTDTAFGNRATPKYQETLIHFTGPRKVYMKAHFFKLAANSPNKTQQLSIKIQ